jgi:hypothetical protein
LFDNWDVEPIANHLNKYQLTVVNSGKMPVKQPPIAQVDELADALVAEYANPDYRAWYCGVINKFGVEKVHEWHRRASEGKRPGRLFTTYVNQAGGYRKSSENIRGSYREPEAQL